MKHKSKRLSRMLLSLLVIGALGAVSASSAMAAPHWSDTSHNIKLSGTLTVSTEGRPTTTCTPPSYQGPALIGSNWALLSSSAAGGNALVYNCANGGQFWVPSYLTLPSTTTIKMGNPSGNTEAMVSPWSNAQYTYDTRPIGDFKNGSGSTQSTLTFGEGDTVGHLAKPIYISGTLTVTTAEGGLLTILP